MENKLRPSLLLVFFAVLTVKGASGASWWSRLWSQTPVHQGGYNPSLSCLKPGITEGKVVKWDPISGCNPPVCGGTHLPDIPHAAGHIPVSLAAELQLLDSQAARKKLAGKCMVLLGDSSMTETAEDLIMLLSGVAQHDALLQSFLYSITRQNLTGDQAHAEACMPFNPTSASLSFNAMNRTPSQCHGVRVQVFGNHRNLTAIIDSERFYMRHRFTGHHNISMNRGGVSTFFEPSFQHELSTLLNSACDGRRPDVLIVNTGRHDSHSHTHFAHGMKRLAEMLCSVQKNGTQVIWKGNYGRIAWHQPWKDAVAQSAVSLCAIPFVDCGKLLDHLLMYSNGTCFTTDNSHYGAIATYHDQTKSVLVSSLLLQGLLQAIK